MADESEVLDVLELGSNLEDVQKPPELPAGYYIGEIQNVQVATSSKGNDYYNVSFVIPADEIPPDVREHYEDGATMSYNRVIKPRSASDNRALFRLKQFVAALGLSTKTTQIDPNEWMGQRAKLKVRHGRYQGETRAEIERVEALDEAPKAERAAPKTTRGRR